MVMLDPETFWFIGICIKPQLLIKLLVDEVM